MRRSGTVAATMLMAVGLLGSAARAATPPDLTGSWINPAVPSAPAWQLQASAGLGELAASYTGAPGPHEHLMGRFSGALNPEGTAYVGTDRVSELGNNVSATMTLTIDLTGSLTVTYQSPNGASTFNLDRMVGAIDAYQINYMSNLQFDFVCVNVSQLGCVGEATAVEQAAKAHGQRRARGMANARRRSKNVILGSVRLSVRPGHRAKISLSLSRTGRKLVATSKSGSVKAVVQLTLNRFSGVPHVTNVGTVTFHK